MFKNYSQISKMFMNFFDRVIKSSEISKLLMIYEKNHEFQKNTKN